MLAYTEPHIRYIHLDVKAGEASWIQIGDARRGATAIQSLPSGNIGDVSGAQSATLEKVWIFEEEGDEIDIVQIGKAYITANHPILTSLHSRQTNP